MSEFMLRIAGAITIHSWTREGGMMMRLAKFSTISVVAVCMLFAISASAWADMVVLKYELPGGNVAATASDLGVSGSNLASGAPASPLASAPSSSANNWFMRDGSGGSGDISTFPITEADAVAANMYFTFTLSASSAVNLTRLTVDLGGTQSGMTFTGAAFLADENGSRIGDVETYAIGGNTSATAILDTLTVDLSGIPAYQNLSSDVTFRVYAYMASGRDDIGGPPNPSQQIIRLDNATVHGDVVPEPASMSLLLGGAMWMIRRRKRR
jgi:hypothetical protein